MRSITLTLKRSSPRAWAPLTALFLATHALAAGVTTTELVPLQSMTLSGRQMLLGEKEGRPAMLAGELRLPGTARSETAKLPAVIVVHGSGGIDDGIDGWLGELNGMGVATFVIDSFSGRGISDTVADQSQLHSLAMVYDAYRALDWLAQHPRIERSRIAIIGFSKGGTAALYAAMERFERAYGSDKSHFAVYLAFYPNCAKYIEDEHVASGPIRVFYGEADDWASIEPCRDYTRRLALAGKDVQFLSFPHAYHAFDRRSLPANYRVRQAQQVSHCRLEERPVGVMRNVDTGKPFALGDACVGRGATIGYNVGAHAAAIKEVKALLHETFKLH